MDNLGVAPEGAEGLDGAGPEDVLVVDRRDGRAHHWADPEDPLIIPSLLVVEDDCGSQAPGRVDTGAGDGMVAKWTMKTAKPIGRGANTWKRIIEF